MPSVKHGGSSSISASLRGLSLSSLRFPREQLPDGVAHEDGNIPGDEQISCETHDLVHLLVELRRPRRR